MNTNGVAAERMGNMDGRRQPRFFAFGANYSHDGSPPDYAKCGCPAIAADPINPPSLASSVVFAFDCLARREKGRDEGVMPEPDARRLWLQAIRLDAKSRPACFRLPHHELARGVQIAAKLGWLGKAWESRS